VKYLVEDRCVDPSSITVITFTAAAARSMRTKISDPRKPETFVQPDLQPRFISTMHSLGYRIIRENTTLLPDSVQVDENLVPRSKRTEVILGSGWIEKQLSHGRLLVGRWMAFAARDTIGDTNDYSARDGSAGRYDRLGPVATGR